MRTNIDIDDDVLDAAMKSGSFRTKKDAVEAGLKLLARQTVYRDLLALQGKLHWDGDSDEPLAPAAPVPIPRSSGRAATPSAARRGKAKP